MSSNAWFFGNTSPGGGHRLWSRERPGDGLLRVGPWTAADLDSKLAPGARLGYVRESAQEQSLCAVHHVDGWTALACWDRTGDERYGSVSVFVFDETLTFEAAASRARESFPGICARIEAAARLHVEVTG